MHRRSLPHRRHPRSPPGRYDEPPSLENIDPLAAIYLRRLRGWWGQGGIELDRLAAPDGREVVFRGPIKVRIRSGASDWSATTEYPPARADGEGPWSAVCALATAIADECLRLVGQPTGRLARHDVGRKGLYLGAIELGLSNIGLPHHTVRWLVGTLDAEVFVPGDAALHSLPIPDALRPADSEGMYFARVPVGRAGRPDGAIDRLEQAGAGRTLKELFERLRVLAGEDDDAA